MSEVLVVKLNPQGEQTWAYTAKVVRRSVDSILVEAFFDREDRDFHGFPLCKGDRFLEIYYSERWYNIFEIHDRQDDRLKGWYCNITRPAVIEDSRVAYVDLALDLLVFADGRQLILDEDEFEQLLLPGDERQAAWKALAELQKNFRAPELFVL